MTQAFDLDGDGTVAPMELARGAELYVESKKTVKRLTKLAAALLVLMGIMLAAIAGLTFSVVEMSKETKTATDGTTLVPGGDAVMKTGAASFAGGLSSALPNAAIEKLQRFEASSGSAFVSLNVNGYVRMGNDGEGDLLLVTPFGLVTVSGSSLTFEDVVADVFQRAGFDLVPASGGRRRLAGFYELQALFNDVTEWEGLDEAGDGDGQAQQPAFPDDYAVDVNVLYQCDTTHKVEERAAVRGDDFSSATVQRDFLLYDGRRCEYPGTRGQTVQVGGVAFQRVRAHMVISNTLKLAREVYYPEALSDHHAIVRLKNASHDSVRYMMDTVQETAAAVRRGVNAQRGLFCDPSSELDAGDEEVLADKSAYTFEYGGTTSLPSSEESAIGMRLDVRIFVVSRTSNGQKVATLYDKRGADGVYTPLRMDTHYGSEEVLFEFGDFQPLQATAIAAMVVGPAECMPDNRTAAWGLETGEVAEGEKALSYYPFGGYKAVLATSGNGERPVAERYQIYRLRKGKGYAAFVAHEAQRAAELQQQIENEADGFAGSSTTSSLAMLGTADVSLERRRSLLAASRASHLVSTLRDLAGPEMEAGGGGKTPLNGMGARHLAEAIRRDLEGQHEGRSLLEDDDLLTFEYGINTPGIAFTFCQATAQHEITIGINIPFVFKGELGIEIADVWLNPFHSMMSVTTQEELEAALGDDGQLSLEIPSVDDIFAWLQGASWRSFCIYGMIWDMVKQGWFDEVWVVALVWLSVSDVTSFTAALGVMSGAIAIGVEDLQDFFKQEHRAKNQGVPSTYTDEQRAAVKAASVGIPTIIDYNMGDLLKAMISIFHAILFPTIGDQGLPFSRYCSFVIQPLMEVMGGIVSIGGVLQFDADKRLDPKYMGAGLAGEAGLPPGQTWEVEGCFVVAIDPLAPLKNLPAIGSFIEDVDSSIELNLCFGVGVDDGTILRAEEMLNREAQEWNTDALKNWTCPGLLRPYLQATAAMPWAFDFTIFGFEIFSFRMNIQLTINYFFSPDERCAALYCDLKYTAVWAAVADKKEEALELYDDVAIDATRKAKQSRAQAESMRQKASGMRSIVSAGEWVKEQLDKGLDMLGLDWADFEIDFYAMDSFTLKAIALGARLALEFLSLLLETEQGVLEKAGQTIDDCIGGNLLDCLGGALDVGAELAAIASIVSMETDCDRYAKTMALGYDPGAEASAGLGILDRGLFGLDWLPFTPRQIIDGVEALVRGLLGPSLNHCVGNDIEETLIEIGALKVEVKQNFDLCIVHAEEDFMLDREKIEKILSYIEQLDPFGQIWDAVKGFVNGIARDTWHTVQQWIMDNTPDICIFSACAREIVQDLINLVPYSDPLRRRLLADDRQAIDEAAINEAEAGNSTLYVGEDVAHVLRSARRRMAETGKHPHLHDILYDIHAYHGLEYDYHGAHAALERATTNELSDHIQRRILQEPDDWDFVDDFFLVRDAAVSLTVSEEFELKMTAAGLGAETGDLMEKALGSTTLLAIEKEIPIFTAISVKIYAAIDLHMPYKFAIYSGEETHLTARLSWKGAFLKFDLATGQLSGDFGTMEDTGIWFEGNVIGQAMQSAYLSLGLKVGICLATLCFTAEVHADSPKISLGASALIVAGGSVTDDVINAFQPLEQTVRYSSYDLQKVSVINGDGDGVVAAGAWAAVSWPMFEAKVVVPAEFPILAATSSLGLGVIWGLLQYYNIFRGNTARLFALKDEKLYVGWTPILDMQEFVDDIFGTEDYGIAAFISGKNMFSATLFFEAFGFDSAPGDGRITSPIAPFPDFALPPLYNKKRGDPVDLIFHRRLDEARAHRRALLQTPEQGLDLPDDVQQNLDRMRGVAEPAAGKTEHDWLGTEGCAMCEGCASLDHEALLLSGGAPRHPQERCVQAAGGGFWAHSYRNETRPDGRVETTFYLTGGAQGEWCRLAGSAIACDAVQADATKFALQSRDDGRQYLKVWSGDDQWDYEPGANRNDFLDHATYPADWWSCLDGAGSCTCGGSGDWFLNGLFRSGCSEVGCIEAGVCSKMSAPSAAYETGAGGSALGNTGWHACPDGQLMTGLDRHAPCHAWQDWFGWWHTSCDHSLANLRQFSCAGVVGVPYSDCYEANVGFNGGGAFKCAAGYAMAGVYTDWGSWGINRLSHFKCCRLETVDRAPSFCNIHPDTGELECGWTAPDTIVTAHLSRDSSESWTLSVTGGLPTPRERHHPAGKVCGVAANGRIRCNYADAQSIDRQLTVQGSCHAKTARFSIEGGAGQPGPLVLEDGSEAGSQMCVDCESEEACHATRRDQGKCTSFRVTFPHEVPGDLGSSTGMVLSVAAGPKEGYCLDCPYQTVEEASLGRFQFRQDDGHGNDRQCRLAACHPDIAHFAAGQTFKQRAEAHKLSVAATPEPGRVCSTGSGEPARYSECAKYAAMCEKYDALVASCNDKKADFIENTLKTTIAKVAEYWQKLGVEAGANEEAAVDADNAALQTERKLVHQQSFLLDQVSVLEELTASVKKRQDSCKQLNFPKQMLGLFEMTLRVCIIGFCFEMNPIRVPFDIPLGDKNEDVTELDGGGSESIEEYVDDLLVGLHENGEEDMRDILDATFNFDDLDNTMTSVYHESSCFDVSSVRLGDAALIKLHAECSVSSGQSLNRFGVKLDEEQCGAGRGVVWWSCVNSLTAAPECEWHDHELADGAFSGALTSYAFDLQCPEYKAMTAFFGSRTRKIRFQCCSAVMLYSVGTDNCVTVEPGYPGAVCNADEPTGDKETMAALAPYQPACDEHPLMLDYQKTGGRVVMTRFQASSVNCPAAAAGFSTKVAVTCCKVVSSRSSGYDAVSMLNDMVFEFTVAVSHIRLNSALGEWGEEEMYIVFRKGGGENIPVNLYDNERFPPPVDTEEDYFGLWKLVTEEKSGGIEDDSLEFDSIYQEVKFEEKDSVTIEMWEDDGGLACISDSELMADEDTRAFCLGAQEFKDEFVTSKTFELAAIAPICTDPEETSKEECCSHGEYGTFCVVVIANVKGM